MWQRIGYTPIMLMVGEQVDWLAVPSSRVAYKRLIACDVRCVFLGQYSGHRDSTVSQVARLYGGDILEDERAYVITADVDMWPLDDQWFTPRDRDGRWQIWYANAYQHHRYPMCYLGATVRLWREVMGHGPLRERLAAQLNTGLGVGADSESAWTYDEQLFAECLKEYQAQPGARRPVYIDRHGNPVHDRIDRIRWPRYPDVSGKLDAHLPRPGFGDGWPLVRPILEQLCSAENLAWADAYERTYNACVSRV